MAGNLVSESELGGEFIRIPNLRRFAYTFAPNETYQLNQTARTLAFIAVTGDLVLSINGGPEIPVFQGITYKMPEGFFFSQLRFRENGGAAASFTIDVSNGDIIDARSSTSGDTPVVNAASPNDSLRVDMVAADPGLVALASSVKGGKTLADVITDLTATLQAIDNSGARLTRIPAGASYYESTSSTSSEITIVSSSANTNGILIYSLTFHDYSSGNNAYVGYRESSILKVIAGHNSSSGSVGINLYAVRENIVLPPNVEFVTKLNTSLSFINTIYKVL